MLSPIRITIDARWLLGGIGTYTRHLLEGLASHAAEFEVHAITREQHQKDVRPWCTRATVVNLPIYTAREQWAIPSAAHGSDLLHVPHYNAPVFSRGPLVVTIHDLVHITDPAYRSSMKAYAYARAMLTFAARTARHIVAVSNFSREQIIERLCIPASKVTAIHEGVNSEFAPIERGKAFGVVTAALGIHEPYLLFVGNLKPHKNIPVLLNAFARLRERRDIPQRLLILGAGEPGRSELVKECVRLNISARVDFVPRVARELLPHLYSAAEVLVMPSRMEGFGLPVLEAMACGTPVVCSHAGSLAEVAGDAAVYFDPQSVDELAAALERVLSCATLRQRLLARGLTRAAMFSWKKCVEKHVEVYRSVVG